MRWLEKCVAIDQLSDALRDGVRGDLQHERGDVRHRGARRERGGGLRRGGHHDGVLRDGALRDGGLQRGRGGVRHRGLRGVRDGVLTFDLVKDITNKLINCTL